MAEAAELLTIGHSTHAADRFAHLLRAHDVELVCDVRRFPSSRRNPQFNAGALRDTLAAAGIDYEPFGEELGGRRGTGDPDRWPRGAEADAFRAYGEYMATGEFAAGLERLEELARGRRTAVMCAEGDWRHCHRRLIADTLSGRGWRILHIRRDGGLDEHQATLA
jgi:uncharacterized protein (DUF488 family)